MSQSQFPIYWHRGPLFNALNYFHGDPRCGFKETVPDDLMPDPEGETECFACGKTCRFLPNPSYPAPNPAETALRKVANAPVDQMQNIAFLELEKLNPKPEE